jgi:Tol biopolymer transport system component
VKRDGTELVEVATPPELGSSPFHNWVWSPDGSMIASDDGLGGIYISNGNGTRARRVADGQAPKWSPDGTRIVFQSPFLPGTGDVFVINPDGTGLSRLTSEPDFDGWPEWSPDGSRILFSSHRDHRWNAYVMNSDGSSQTPLRRAFEPSRESGETSFASWSPNGKLIVFSGNDSDIYVANADGSDIRNLTKTSWAWDDSPVWSPLLP